MEEVFVSVDSEVYVYSGKAIGLYDCNFYLTLNVIKRRGKAAIPQIGKSEIASCGTYYLLITALS